MNSDGEEVMSDGKSFHIQAPATATNMADIYLGFFAGAELLPFSANFLFFWMLAICPIVKHSLVQNSVHLPTDKQFRVSVNYPQNEINVVQYLYKTGKQNNQAEHEATIFSKKCGLKLLPSSGSYTGKNILFVL